MITAPKKQYKRAFPFHEKLVNFNENIGISLISKMASTKAKRANNHGLPHIAMKNSS